MKSRTQHPRPLGATIVLLLLVLWGVGLVLTGCSTDFSLSCGGTDDEAKTYTDADYGYSFQYPGDWRVEQGDTADVTAGSGSEGGMSVYDPDGAVAGDYYIDLLQVSVYELTVTVDEAMMPEVKSEVEDMLSDLETQGAGWTKVEGLTEATAGGIDGYKATYTFDTTGTPTTSTFYFLFTGNIQYQLTLQAATENWEGKQAQFDSIVASFKPGAEQ